jgi:transcriptional regulator with XRE-family HTH domain
MTDDRQLVIEMLRQARERRDVAQVSGVRGIDLKLLRVEQRVTGAALARAAGWSRSRVVAIEATDMPTARSVTRYLDALRDAADAR